jgi:hypothetical protein
VAWKDVLVFADGSEGGLARVQMAALMALDFDCGLEVCVPAIIPQPFASGGTAFASEVIDRVREVAEGDASQAAAIIRLLLPDLQGMATIAAPEIGMKELPRLVATLCQRSDIVVVGQPIGADLTRTDEIIFDAAVLRTGRPVLMMPRWPTPREWGRRAVVAWKGVSGSARAVHDALPLLVRCESVGLFSCGHGPELNGEGPVGLARIAEHLRSHGVKVELPVIGPDGSPGRAILEHAKASRADLIVMGAYDHSRFRERTLGGATRTVVLSSPVPVLVSH